MKKTSITIVLLLFMLLLNGCTSKENQSKIEDFTNKEDNTKEEILRSLQDFDRILKDYELKEPIWEHTAGEDTKDLSYPIQKEDLVASKSDKLSTLSYDDGDYIAKDSIKVLLDNFSTITTLNEDERTQFTAADETDMELLIAINENELSFELYSHTDLQVSAQYVHIYYQDEKLTLATSSFDYFAMTSTSYYRQTQYSEDEFQTSKVYATFGDSKTLSYTEQDFVKNTYLRTTLSDSYGNSVQHFDEKSNMYYAIRYFKDTTSESELDLSVQTIDIMEFDNNNLIYALEYEDRYQLDYHYNLNYIDSWDTIKMENDEATLYYEENKVVLPLNAIIEANQASAMFLSGSGGVPNHLEDMDLEGSTLTPPITYKEFTKLQTNLEKDASKLITDFYDNNYKDDEIQSDFIFNYLDQDIVEAYLDSTN